MDFHRCCKRFAVFAFCLMLTGCATFETSKPSRPSVEEAQVGPTAPEGTSTSEKLDSEDAQSQEKELQAQIEHQLAKHSLARASLLFSDGDDSGLLKAARERFRQIRSNRMDPVERIAGYRAVQSLSSQAVSRVLSEELRLIREKIEQLRNIQNLQQTLNTEGGTSPESRSIPGGQGGPSSEFRDGPRPYRTTPDSTLKLDSVIRFKSGSADLTPGARIRLSAMSRVIKDHPTYTVRVAGHTDSVPTGGGDFASNLELSALRSVRVAEYFIRQEGINPDRMEIMAFGSALPVRPNDSPENRARNRRVEIILIPSETRPAL